MREVRIQYHKETDTWSVYWFENGKDVAAEGFINEVIHGIPLHEPDVKFLKGEL